MDDNYDLREYVENTQSHLSKATESYKKFQDDQNLPDFHKTYPYIQLAKRSLEYFEKHLVPADATVTDLDKYLATAQEAAQKADSLFKRVSVVAKESRKAVYEGLVQKDRKKKVEYIFNMLLESMHHPVEQKVIKVDDANLEQDLLKAIKELKKIVGDQPGNGSHVYGHHGNGDMYNNTAGGSQNIHKGTGPQNNAGTVNMHYGTAT